MPTHRIYGDARITGPVVRTAQIIDAEIWQSSGVAAAVLATVTSDAMTGEWEALLDSDALVYVLTPPVPPYRPLLLGPYRPEPI
jgi:hypothetical protein